MKIATYNIWNDEKTLGLRTEQLLCVIRQTDADIIGLQEVPVDFYQKYLIKESGYAYHVFAQYPREEEGLAVLSRFPVLDADALFEKETYANSLALHLWMEIENVKFSFTNVHLPWDSVKTREKQIIAIDRYIHEQEADFYILLGDFNNDTGSSVDRYLGGGQTLQGCEANPCWNDLASAYAMRNGEPVPATLDVVNNPRWKGTKSIYSPEVMDRIYIMDHWYETALEEVRIFGTEVSDKTGYAASDHYGVLAEVTFRK